MLVDIIVHKQDCNIQIFKCQMILPIVIFEMVKDPVCYLSKLPLPPLLPCSDNRTFRIIRIGAKFLYLDEEVK